MSNKRYPDGQEPVNQHTAGSGVSWGSSKEAEKGKTGIEWPILVNICPCCNRSLKRRGRELGIHLDSGMGEIGLMFSARSSLLKYLLARDNGKRL